MAPVHKSGAFLVKKWTLFTGAVLLILNAILMAVFTWIYVYPDERQRYDSSHISELVVYFAIIFSLILVVINLSGAVGAYREHYCLTLTYGVLMLINTLFSVYLAYVTRETASRLCSLAYVFISGALAVLAFLLARDLRSNSYGDLPAPEINSTNSIVDNKGYILGRQTTV